MEKQACHEWEECLNQGEQYMRTALGGSKRKAVFTNELLFNIVAMAVENYFMGFFQYHGRMPENHTLSDLVRGLEEITVMDKKLADGLLDMDRFQQICAWENYCRESPKDEDIKRFLGLGIDLEKFIFDKLKRQRTTLLKRRNRSRDPWKTGR